MDGRKEGRKEGERGRNVYKYTLSGGHRIT
jgi:hypothetical protein